jgi:hypothetical protein
MRGDSRRITLLARAAASPTRPWNVTGNAPNRIVFVDVFSMLPFALDRSNQDVDRVVIDGTATPVEYLELLATLPHDFPGDVLYMREGGSSFLSSVGRGGGRVLYSMTSEDLSFYLQTNALLAA